MPTERLTFGGDDLPKNERQEISAEGIKNAAKDLEAHGVAEFAEILATLSDEEILQLDEQLRTTGAGLNSTLAGFPTICKDVNYDLSGMAWGKFRKGVEDWQNAKADPDPRGESANEQFSLLRKRKPIVRALAEMMLNA